MTVTPVDANQCIVNWISSFTSNEGTTEEEAKEFIEAFYEDGLASLHDLFVE
jgi:hypothetical protein